MKCYFQCFDERKLPFCMVHSDTNLQGKKLQKQVGVFSNLPTSGTIKGFSPN